MPETTRAYIDTVRNASPIMDIIAPRVRLKGLMGLCPFHSEKTPSFSVSPGKGVFWCHGCHEGGDVFAFLEKIDRLSFWDAVAVLAERAHLPPPPTRQDPRPDGDALTWAAEHYRSRWHTAPDRALAVSYLTTDRQLPLDLLDAEGIGWADGTIGPEALKLSADSQTALLDAGVIAEASPGWPTRYFDRFHGRVIFSIWEKMQAQFLTGRAIMGSMKPKYLHVRGRPAPLYGSDQITSETTRVLITEGPIDALSLRAWGYTAVALLGSARKDVIPVLQKIPRPVFVLDNDPAGRAAVVRITLEMDPLPRVVWLPPGMDPNDCYRTMPQSEFDALLANAPEAFAAILQTVNTSLAIDAWTRPLQPVIEWLASLPRPVAEARIEQMCEALHLRRVDSRWLRQWTEEIRTGFPVVCHVCGTMLRAGAGASTKRG